MTSNPAAFDFAEFKDTQRARRVGRYLKGSPWAGFAVQVDSGTSSDAADPDPDEENETGKLSKRIDRTLPCSIRKGSCHGRGWVKLCDL